MNKMNKKIIFVILVGLILISGCSSIKKNDDFLNKTTITIDASKTIGEMPFIYRAGIWKQDNGQDFVYITEKFFGENSVGKVQLEIGWYELARSEDFEDFKNRTKKKYEEDPNNRNIIEKAKSSGQTLIIGHWPAKMPEWLSSRAGDNSAYSDTGFTVSPASPPKCYGYKCTKMEEITCYTEQCINLTKKQLAEDGYVVGWSGVIDYTIRYFRNDLGVENLGYYFGHEQNKDWIGSEEEYYKTYESTAKAVKAIDRGIFVGGAGPWNALAPRIKCGPPHYNEVGTSICSEITEWSIDGKYDPMNKNFIEYAKNNDLPVDFINWHSFGVSSSLFLKQAEDARIWLKDNGFDENTPLYPADWTVWANWYPADYIDTEYNPPYIINTLYNMDKAGIQWHGHDFDVGGNRGVDKGVNAVVKQRGENAQFIGTWAIFTPEQVIKPAYNTFRLSSILYGKQENSVSDRIEINISDEFITAVASKTKDNSKTRVLISNFIPDGDMLTFQLFNKFQESPSLQSTKVYKEKIVSCIQETAVTKEQITQCIKQVINNVTDPVMKERINTQIQLFYCFKFGVNKIQCVQNVYSTTSDEETKRDIDAIKAEYQKILKYQKEPRQITINLKNLPQNGKATLTTYTIDKDHSNSCRYNKKTEESPTNTECGINGEVDKQVAQAKTEAKEKSLQTTIEYLKEKYSNEELESIKEQVILPCIQSNSALLCINTNINDTCTNLSIECEQLKQNLIDSYQKYQEVYKSLFFYGKYNDMTTSIWIDKINNDPNISLEGSKTTKQIEIKNGTYQETITIQPYSVVLIEIER